MACLAEALAALAALEGLLREEVAHAEREGELLRRLDAQALLTATGLVAPRTAALERQVEHSRDRLAQLYAAAGAAEPTLDGLARVDAAAARALREALAGVRASGLRLAAVRRFNHDVSSRALRLVRAIEQRRSPAPDAYGRTGRPGAPAPELTTSHRA